MQTKFAHLLMKNNSSKSLRVNRVRILCFPKKQGVTVFVTPWLIMSGQKDSNLRPPAPKAGALAGLRHTPKKKTIFIVFFLRGEGGIRTPGTHCWIRQFSKLLVSATHPPLLGCELRCKNRLFSHIHNRFLPLFLKIFCYSLNYSAIEYRCFACFMFDEKCGSQNIIANSWKITKKC